MSSIVQGAASPARPGQRWFWLAGALFAALVVFVGFSPTFYLRNLFGAPQLSTLKLVHGVVFSAWVVLFVAQTWLVAANRRDVHRALGAFGALLLVAMCVVGYRVAIESGRSGFTPDPAKVSALSFMAVPLFDLAVFALLVSAAHHVAAGAPADRQYAGVAGPGRLADRLKSTSAGLNQRRTTSVLRAIKKALDRAKQLHAVSFQHDRVRSFADLEILLRRRIDEQREQRLRHV
jgi:hypothetical protein